jgi:hypothetical protein
MNAFKAKFQSGEKAYVLEFNADSIIKMERNGFDISDLEKRPLESVETMLYYALQMHQSGIMKKESDALFREIIDAKIGVKKLADILGEIYVSIANPTEDQVKSSAATLETIE